MVCVVFCPFCFVNAEDGEGGLWQYKETTEKVAEKLIVKNASDYDVSLPAKAFEEWLRSVLPKPTTLIYELNDCGEQTGDSQFGSAHNIPVCLAIEAEIFSRARNMELLFDKETLEFRSGAVFSEELEGVLNITKLSNLEAALKKPLRPFPLICREGTTLKLREQDAGLYEWCENKSGHKQGPYRSWFSTGIYLMEKGQYKDNIKIGVWIECNRFESCQFKSYR